MKKIRYTNFEALEDVIKSIDFNYDKKAVQEKVQLENLWEETIGKKILQFAKVYNFSADNTLTIVCSDSYIANELYMEKDKLLSMMNKKTSETGITIKDIIFNYKKWKEKI